MSETVLVREYWYVNTKRWLNRAIALVTWPPNPDTEAVTHCEIEDMQAGMMYTSTTRGKANGTVVRPAAGVLDKPENWYFTVHEVDAAAFQTAKFRAQIRVDTNEGYSWRDLGRYIMPLWLLKATGLADNGREICSEHVESWLVDMGVLDKRLLRSPRRLCRDTVLATGSPLRRLVDGVVVRDKMWVKHNGTEAWER